MSFDVNITVNGNRCKQYQFQGKTFIEAKDGSEYVIELKNSYYKRILAISSVDGLNVLTGKSASDTDSGYIVGSHSSEKIKGFRFSDAEWALFKFGYKFDGKTYAQSKGDGAEKNCGVIGVKFFYEQEPTYSTPNNTFNNSPWDCWPKYPIYPSTPLPKTWITYTCNNTSTDWAGGDSVLYDNSNLSSGRGLSSGATKSSGQAVFNNSVQNMVQQQDSLEIKPQSFDMGTQWGRKETSKVHTVAFERGYLAQTFEIFYASRVSLMDMGVIVDNKLQTNLPQSFPSQYATPPSGWRG